MAALHWSATFLGIPYRDGGRDRDGADCWGLIGLVYLAELGIVLPAWGDDCVDAIEAAEIARIVAGGPSDWVEVDRPGAYDVVVFLAPQGRPHAGVMIGPDRMVHVEEKGDLSRVESLFNDRWIAVERRFFRRRELAA